ncbi:MAG TPA: 4-demethylwyosine synthase TYW1 [archaeon]|nr:4-demethylwyosine synthase TYW1 [archaeon]
MLKILQETKQEYLPNYKKLLRHQKYGTIGQNTAVKICHWTKSSIKGEGTCYKNKFYGIESHQCIQMTPNVSYCNHKCNFCWRPLTGKNSEIPVDDPEFIVEESIEHQIKLLSGLGGISDQIDLKKFKESSHPKHVAISLAGEPTLYPRISELIEAYHKRGCSTFLVSNGTRPETLASMTLPTQLYISLESPTKELYDKINRSDEPDSFYKLMKTLEILPMLNCRKAVRITCLKGMNMEDIHAEQFAEKLKIAQPDFVEVKAYMHVGFSRKRMREFNMPSHKEVIEFAQKINEHLNYHWGSDHEPSRVAMLCSGKKEAKINFEELH